MKKYHIVVSIFFVFMFPSNGFAENQGVLSMEELSIHSHAGVCVSPK